MNAIFDNVATNEKISAALFSLVAVTISALISSIVAIYVAQSSTRREIRKSQMGSLMDKITERRIAEYPKLYSIISNMIKVMKNEPLFDQDQSFSTGYLTNCLKQINEWDNNYSIFLGSDSISAIIWLKYNLYEILRKHQNNAGLISDANDRNVIIRCVEKLELNLKNEVGIFPLEYGLEKRKTPSYVEIDERQMS